MSTFKIQKHIEKKFIQDPDKFLNEIGIMGTTWFPEVVSYSCPFHKHFAALNIDKTTGVWSCDDGCQGDIVSLIHKITERNP